MARLQNALREHQQYVYRYRLISLETDIYFNKKYFESLAQFSVKHK